MCRYGEVVVDYLRVRFLRHRIRMLLGRQIDVELVSESRLFEGRLTSSKADLIILITL